MQYLKHTYTSHAHNTHTAKRSIHRAHIDCKNFGLRTHTYYIFTYTMCIKHELKVANTTIPYQII